MRYNRRPKKSILKEIRFQSFKEMELKVVRSMGYLSLVDAKKDYQDCLERDVAEEQGNKKVIL